MPTPQEMNDPNEVVLPKEEVKTTFTAEELKELKSKLFNDGQEKARGEEKDKLYKELQSNKDSLKALQTSLTNLEKEKQEAIDKATKISEEERQKGLSEVEKAKEFFVSELQTLKAGQDTLVTESKQLKTDLKKARLETVKERLLAKHPNIIPELVIGNTIEELEASIPKAEEVYKRIAGTKEKDPVTKTTVKPDPAPERPDSSTISIDSIQNMSLEEYKKNRDKIKSNFV